MGFQLFSFVVAKYFFQVLVNIDHIICFFILCGYSVNFAWKIKVAFSFINNHLFPYTVYICFYKFIHIFG